ncbi:MAG: efflux RND transporter periplasmic adaptor subunit [Planctomycetaceae bacterium]|nr:efflux RND transporter periplasmic adaptor subunit [Planctomycetaceae bacterium]
MMPSWLPGRLVVLAGVAGLLIVGCGQPNQYQKPPPPQVSVMAPVQKSVTEYLEFSGMTQPMETVEIRARVKGFLEERHFVEGGIVTQGQLLLVIDEEPFQIQLEAARTRLREAEAALEQATVSKAREVARAQVKLAESQLHLANQEEQRLSNLIARKVATDAEMDQAVATRQAREAEVESAKARLEQETASYDTTILSCEAAVESARIAVRNADLDLSYCRMHAPIGGRISRVNYDIGNLVGDGESSVLATIVKVDPIHAYATISENDVLKTPALRQVGAVENPDPIPVELGIPGQPGFPVVGKIDYADPRFDGETGTLRTRGLFPNAAGSLLPGMFVRMRIPVAEKPNSLLVPERALGTDQSGEFVLVVRPDNVVEQRIVKTSVTIDGYRVVEGNLAVSDHVIVDGLLRARPGEEVSPELMSSPASLANSHDLAGRR